MRLRRRAHKTDAPGSRGSGVVDLVGEAGVPQRVGDAAAEVGRGDDDDVEPAAGGVGGHPANGLASLFIACGQGEANVAESHAALINTTLL